MTSHLPELDRLARWARRLGAGERLQLGCADVPPDARHRTGLEDVRWSGCLNDLDAGDLAALVASTPGLTLLLGGCAPAPDSPARELERLLNQLGLGHRLEVRGRSGPTGSAVGSDVAGGTDLPVSRRDLFAWVRAAPPGEQGSPPGERRELPGPGEHGEAGSQVRLASVLRELLRQEGGRRGPVPQQPGPPTMSLSLQANGCTACHTCVRACPTQALALTTSPDGRRATLELLPEACLGCRRCLALCPVEALRDEGPLAWDDLLRRSLPVELETVALRTCARCRTPFAGDGDLCQVCALRAADPFGSWLPPGYVAPRVYAPPPTGEE